MKRLGLLFAVSIALITVAGLLAGATLAAPRAPVDAVTRQTLDTARQLYAQGDYALAARTYQQVVDRGYADPTLFYNLGLAYVQAGDAVRGQHSLEQARQLRPRDPAIRRALAELHGQAIAGRTLGSPITRSAPDRSESDRRPDASPESAGAPAAAVQADPTTMSAGLTARWLTARWLTARWLTADELAAGALLLWAVAVALVVLLVFRQRNLPLGQNLPRS